MSHVNDKFFVELRLSLFCQLGVDVLAIGISAELTEEKSHSRRVEHHEKVKGSELNGFRVWG